MVSKYRSSIHPKRDVLPDGTEVRLVPLERTNNHDLYASQDGRVFSLHGKSYYPLRPTVTNYPCNRANGRRKQKYLKLTKTYGYILVHTAVALAWIGDKPAVLEVIVRAKARQEPEQASHAECYVVDHLNGITTDNRAENLQWVTRQENDKRAKLLRVLRSIGRDPQKMSREELLEIFNKYEFTNPQNID